MLVVVFLSAFPREWHAPDPETATADVRRVH